MATFPVTITERLTIYKSEGVAIQKVAALHEMTIFSNVLSRLRRSPVTVRDRLALRQSLGAHGTFHLALRSGLMLRAALGIGSQAFLRSVISIRPHLTAAQKTAIRDTIRIAARTSLHGVYTASLRSAVRLKDQTPTFALGAFLRSRVALSGNLSRTYRAYGTLGDRLALHDVLGRKAVLTVVSHDNVRLTATAALRGIFKGTLRDTIDFVLDVVEPDGSVTTWAVNTRTGSVTEYTNFDFNSFARTGRGTYLGAATDGLYELVGPDDAGTPVVADMLSGLVEFSGAFLSSIKAAYLGIRGEGEFFLRLADGEGRTFVYGVQSRNLRTTRVNIGKGLRARYFTWELISVGQDFDLTSVTFLPLQSTRRV